jgi:acetoin utilization protein AcuB
MRIEEIMTKNAVTVKMDDSLSHVKHLFETHHFHHLLVVEKHKLVGILSDRDLLKAISPKIGTAAESSKDAASLNKRVHQIMNRDLIMLTAGSTLLTAVQAFNRHKISCIPIIDEQQRPLGIVSWRDVFKLLESKLLAIQPDQ